MYIVSSPHIEYNDTFIPTECTLDSATLTWSVVRRYRMLMFEIVESSYLPDNKMYAIIGNTIITKPGWSKYIGWMFTRLCNIARSKKVSTHHEIPSP